MSAPDIRTLMDAVVAADKTLAGTNYWKPDEDGDAHRWIGVIEVAGELPGVNLVVKAYPRSPALKFRIMLNAGRCIWRLDYDHDGHLNPLNAPGDPGILIREPHYHSWADNRRLATVNSLPRRLRNARLLPAGIRSFNSAFRWFVQQTNIQISSLDTPDLPKTDTLL
jgi:hypothetical protein